MSERVNVDIWVRPNFVFDHGRLIEGAAVGIANGKIIAIAEPGRGLQPAKVIEIEGIIAPGFVDLQVNGGGGVLLNEHPTKEAMWDIAKAHKGFGTTAILPTVICWLCFALL